MWEAVRNQKVGKFVGVNGLVVIRLKNVVMEVQIGIVSVVFGVINGVVGAPFDDKTTFLDKGSTLVESKRFNASNGSVREGKDGPIVA
jgi:hypothetical protein